MRLKQQIKACLLISNSLPALFGDNVSSMSLSSGNMGISRFLEDFVFKIVTM